MILWLTVNFACEHMASGPIEFVKVARAAPSSSGCMRLVENKGQLVTVMLIMVTVTKVNYLHKACLNHQERISGQEARDMIMISERLVKYEDEEEPAHVLQMFFSSTLHQIHSMSHHPHPDIGWLDELSYP